MQRRNTLPIPVNRALRQLGQNIKDARRLRRIPMPLMAERAGLSRTTLTQIEKGAPTVAMGNYAAVLFILGMAGNLQNLATDKESAINRRLIDDILPKRVHLRRLKTLKDSDNA